MQNSNTPPPTHPMSLSALLLRRFTLRHWRQAPRHTLLLLLILALGIAVFVSVRLANQAAVASFRNFTDVITRQSDLVVSAPAGDLPETVLGDMRQALTGLGVQLIPVFETTATRPRLGDDQTIATRETF